MQPIKTRLFTLIAFLLPVIAGTALIASTYSVFNQTYDESAHIAAGMEWLSRGTYTYEALHPPLARIAVALGPYLNGARTHGVPEIWMEGNTVLGNGTTYWKNLTLSRLGVLPFFWLACFLVWSFTARRFGRWEAFIALLLFAFCPVVLAHSSIATTDAPLMATFFLALIGFLNLLEKPGIRNAILAGIFLGAAVLTKFTSIPFLIVACGIVWITLHYRKHSIPWKFQAVTVAVVLFLVWTAYRFSIGPILPKESTVAAATASPDAPPSQMFHKLPHQAEVMMSYPHVPADEFFLGIVEMAANAKGGRHAYLLGSTYDGGRWYFFPVAILVKTPIPLLLLSLTGIALILFVPALRSNSAITVLAGLIGPLAVAIPGNVNLGIRHIIPIYPFLAILGGIAAVRLWNAGGKTSLSYAYKALVLLLLAWSIETCVKAAPDFLAYFSEPFVSHSDAILVDSDLDWGQDLNRLSQTLHEKHIDNISIAYFGRTDLTHWDLPSGWRRLQAKERPSGWIAVSKTRLKIWSDDYGWLSAYQPTMEVGHSILLYWFPPANSKSLAKSN